ALRTARRGPHRLARGGARLARAGGADARLHPRPGGARLGAQPGAAPHPVRDDRGRPLARPRGRPDRARPELARVRTRGPVVSSPAGPAAARLALLAALLLAGGCLAPGTSPRFYTLGAVGTELAPLAARPELGLAVGPVEFPRYLERPE